MKWKTRYIRYRKITKRLRRFMLFFMFFFLICGYLVFKSSLVQTKLTNQIGKVLSQKTNAKISVEKVDFKPFKTFVLKGLLILDHHNDTLLYANDFSIEIKDYDIEKRMVNLKLLELHKADFNIRKYKGEPKTNLKYFLSGLIKKKKKRREWSIYINQLGLEELNFTYEDDNKLRKVSRVDFKHLKLNNVNADFKDLVFDKGILRLNSKLLSLKEKSGFEITGLKGDFFMDKNRLVFKNFEVLEHYNSADAYVIGVGHLADRIAGGSKIKTKWPRSDRALSFAERQEMQRRLTSAGFNTKGIDGKIGPLTIAAVRAFQRRAGLPADGYASLQLLKRLRR